MSRFTLQLLTAALFAIQAQAELVTYPAGPGVETLNDFSVRVRQNGRQWTPVDVYPVKVDKVMNGRHNVEIASMAYFDFDGTVDVEVVSNRQNVEASRIRPLSYNITPDVSGDTLTFSLSEPRNLSIEVNGDIFHNLHLFANPIDVNRPSAKVLKNLKKHKDLIYFAPGSHNLPGDTLHIPSNTTVYIDGGAYVHGELKVNGSENVNIYGRGEVHPVRGAGVSNVKSKNVTVDGIIVTQLPVIMCDSVTVTNVKSISSYGWGDGMNVYCSKNVRYDRVFCRNSDDCTTVYASRGDSRGSCDNILMENSTLWADVAHPIMIGLHGAATEIGVDAPSDTIQNLTYRNLDILDQMELQKDYQGVFAISCGDNNIVRDVTFDNIRVEDFRCGQLVNVRIFMNEKYCKAPGKSVDNVLFRDVTYTGRNASTSIICGYDDNRQVAGLTFENLTVNGVKITDDMPGKPKWYKAGDMCDIYIGNHVRNVVFK